MSADNQPGTNTDFNPLGQHVNQAEPNLVVELWGFLLANKKWWLAPIIVVFLLLGALVLLSGTGAAPFIYTLF